MNKVIKKKAAEVEFDRTPLLERLKARYLNMYTVGNFVWFVFRFLLLLGVAYVILFPFYSKIATSFMSAQDFVDVTVRLVPRYPTLDTYKAIITENGYLSALLNTFILAGSCALIQTFVCCIIGYGFAKFKFKFNDLLFLLVIFLSPLAGMVPGYAAAGALIYVGVLMTSSLARVNWQDLTESVPAFITAVILKFAMRTELLPQTLQLSLRFSIWKAAAFAQTKKFLNLLMNSAKAKNFLRQTQESASNRRNLILL